METMGFKITHLYGLTESYGPSLICETQAEWEELPLAERAQKMARQGVPHVWQAIIGWSTRKQRHPFPLMAKPLARSCFAAIRL
jgi:hypothetical protein